MAQRKLNVKVSADIDKSLVDLLKKLDSTKARTLKVKAVIDDKAITAFSDKLTKMVAKEVKTKVLADLSDMDELAKKIKSIEKDPVDIKLKVDDRQLATAKQLLNSLDNKVLSIEMDVKGGNELASLKREIASIPKIDIDSNSTSDNLRRTLLMIQALSKSMDGLNSKRFANTFKPSQGLLSSGDISRVRDNIEDAVFKEKIVYPVDIKADQSSLDKVTNQLDSVEDKTQKLTGKTHVVSYRAEGLNEMLNGLDNLSSKILSVAKGATMSIGRFFASQVGELYDSQKSFETAGIELGLTGEDINSAMQTLGDFGRQSKYTVADLNRTAIALKGAGFDEDFGGFANLTTNLAKLVAMSPTAATDFSRMSKAIQDLSPDGQASKGIWNQVTRAAGGVATARMNELLRAKTGVEDINKAFKSGAVNGQMLMEIFNEVGSSAVFDKIATQSNTLRSAFDNLVESMVLGLAGTDLHSGELKPTIEGIIKVMNDLQAKSEDVTKKIGRSINELVATLSKAFANFDINKFVDDLGRGLTPLRKMIELATQLYSVLTNKSANTGTIIGWAVSLSAIYMTARKATSVVSTLSKLMGGGGGGGLLGNLLKGKKGKASAPDIDGEGIAKSLNPLQGLNLQGLVNSLSNATLLVGIAGSLKLMASAMNDIGKLRINGNTINNLIAIVGTLGTLSFLLGKMDGLLAKMGTSKTSIAKGALLMTGISVSLAIIVKAFEYMSNVKIDHMNTLANLGTIGLVLAGYATLSAIVGNFAPQIALGALTLTGLSLSLVAITWAMEETVKNVNDIVSIDLPDPSDVLNQMQKLGEIMGYIAWESFWSGLKSFFGGIGGLLGTFGNMAQALYFDSIRILIAKVNEFIQIADTSPDPQAVRNAMKKISKLLEALRGEDGILAMSESKGNDFLEFWDSISDTLVNIVQGWELDTLMDNLTKFSDFIKKIMDAPIPEDLSGVRAKMTALKNLMDEMTRVTTEVMHSADQMKSTYTSSGSLGGVLSAMFQNMELDSLIPAMEKMAKFVEDLAGVPEIDASQMESIKTKLKNMNEVMNALKTALNDNGDGWDFGFLEDMVESWGSFFQKEDISNMTKGFKKLVDLTNSLIELQIDDSVVESIKTKMESIKKVMEELSKFEMPNIESIEGDTLKAIGSVKKLVEAMTEVINLVMGIPEQDISAKVTAIEKALTEIERLPKHTIFSNDAFDKDLTSKVDSISKFITALGTISQQLATIMGMPDLAGIEVKIGQIENALTAVSSDSFMQVLDKFKGKTDYGAIGTEIQTLVTALGQIATTLLNLPELESSVVTTKINAIKQSLETISADGGILTSVTKLQGKAEQFNNVKLVIDAVNNIATALSTVPDIAGLDIPTRLAKVAEALGAMTGTEGITGKVALLQGKTEQFTTAVSVINAVKTIVDTLNSIPAVNSEQLMTTITAIKNALNEIASINASGETLAGLDAVIAKLNELKTVVTTLATEMTTAGTNAGNNYATAFVAGIGTKLVDKMRTEMNAIIALDWAGTGTTIANKLVQAFETGIGTKLSDKVNKERLAIEAQDWSGTGTRISTALTNGFDISGILAKIQQIQTAINNLQGKTIEVTINQTTVERTVKRQHGGIIPEYHSTGGVIGRGWKQSGTDTVPAMLTAGEYVLKRSVTSYLGTQFLNALNNMNLTTAMKHLASKMGNQVVHNTTNNITQNVDNKASFLNGLNDLKGVIRA